jgi:hypothetical protein
MYLALRATASRSTVAVWLALKIIAPVCFAKEFCLLRKQLKALTCNRLRNDAFTSGPQLPSSNKM